MKVLSIIVPAYNSASFLDKGISSFLQNEVLDKLDIIIVDDGSTDDTAAVAQTYCDRYPGTVRLVRQENKGHGGALNTGCTAAAGKYLRIVDADDWVNTESLPAYLRWLEELDSDVVLTNYNTRDISDGTVKLWRCPPDALGRTCSLEEILEKWRAFAWLLTIHGITYRTDFYREWGIRLSEHVFYEDYEFSTFPCCHAKTITPLDLTVYEYRVGDAAQSVSDANQLRRIGHTETVLNRMLREYEAQALTDAGREFVCRKTAGLLMSYDSTVLLVDPHRSQGRRRAGKMMQLFRQQLPRVFALTRKQYLVFYAMNLLGLKKRHWEAVRDSGWYQRLRSPAKKKG